MKEKWKGAAVSLEDTFVVSMPTALLTETQPARSLSKCETSCTALRHAQTCLMWKLTTYSALVR